MCERNGCDTSRFEKSKNRAFRDPLNAHFCEVQRSYARMAEATCPHTPVNTAPALKYLFNHDFASADRTGDEDVATMNKSHRKLGTPLAQVPTARTTTRNAHGRHMEQKGPPIRPSTSTPATCTRKNDLCFDVRLCIRGHQAYFSQALYARIFQEYIRVRLSIGLPA